MGKKWERFKHFDEGAYWREICAMSEKELRTEHKILQQSLLSAGAGAGASAVAGIYTLGAAWALTAVNARRCNVTSRQIDLVERRLSEEGWSGHDLRKRDIALGVGPCVAMELAVPAGGALLSQATHHATTAAAGHMASTAAQHATQAATQHMAQTATEQAAQNIAQHAPVDALTNCLNHTSDFVHSAVQGVQSEIFTNSAGAVGHASAQYFSALPADAAAAQAQILGAAAGQALATEVAREGLSQGSFYATKYGLQDAIDSSEKKSKQSIILTEKETTCASSSASASDTNSSSDSDEEQDPDEPDPAILEIAILLLNERYQNMHVYDHNGDVKSDINLISTCTVTSCDCTDYNDHAQSQASSDGHAICLCGHDSSSHSQDGDRTAFLRAICEEWYPHFEHRMGNRMGDKKKTDWEGIEGCEECECGDYDEDVERECVCNCGHANYRHDADVMGEEQKMAWVIKTVVVGVLELLGEHDED